MKIGQVFQCSAADGAVGFGVPWVRIDSRRRIGSLGDSDAEFEVSADDGFNSKCSVRPYVCLRA